MDIILSYYHHSSFTNLLHEFDKSMKCSMIVYNKSGKQMHFPHKRVTVHSLPNVGREGETYLNHIIRYYDTLNEYTLFIQDDVHNHIPNPAKFVQFCKESIRNRVQCSMYPCTWRENGPVIRRTIHHGLCDLHTFPRTDSILECCHDHGIVLPDTYMTETCAFFLCHRSAIRKRSKEFYVNLRTWLLMDERNGYVLEHLWKLIFR